MRKLASVLIVVSVVVTATTATAGYHWPGAGVAISTDTHYGPMWAAGSIGGVRNSSSEADGIGCGVLVFRELTTVVCSASTSDADVHCWSTDPGMIDAIRSVSGDDYIQFTVGDDAPEGRCVSLEIYKSSIYAPKAP